MEELKLNHTYLLKYGTGSILNCGTILLVTKKAYLIQWTSDNKEWELKELMNRNYTVVEDITDFMGEKKESDDKSNLIQCPVCKGKGTILDDEASGMTRTCPLCKGSKMIPEK